MEMEGEKREKGWRERDGMEGEGVMEKIVDKMRESGWRCMQVNGGVERREEQKSRQPSLMVSNTTNRAHCATVS